MLGKVIKILVVVIAATLAGFLVFDQLNKDPQNNEADTTDEAPAPVAERDAELSNDRLGIKRHLIDGRPVLAELGPCSNQFPNLGTLRCGESYRVVYATDSQEWTVTGPLSSSTPHTATYGPIAVINGRMSMWGAVFHFDEEGRVATPTGTPVGQLSLLTPEEPEPSG